MKIAHHMLIPIVCSLLLAPLAEDGPTLADCAALDVQMSRGREWQPAIHVLLAFELPFRRWSS